MDLDRISLTDAACMQPVEQLRWGDADQRDSLRLLRGASNSVDDDRTQEYLLARLQERAK